MRRSPQGTWITSSSAVIRALTYLRTEVNVDPGLLRVHGVNMSLGCEWQPDQYAAGQSPLCQAVNQLVASGVVVVVSAGNYGASTTRGDSANTSAIMGSITEPAHAQDCIAVGIDAPRGAARLRCHLDLRQGPDAGRPDEAGRGGAGRVDRLGRHRPGPRDRRTGPAGRGSDPGEPADLRRAVRHVDGGAARFRRHRRVPVRPAGVHRPAAAGQEPAHAERHRPGPGTHTHRARAWST